MINQGKTLKLDQLVDMVLKQAGLYRGYKECEVTRIWPEVVGKMIASKTKNLHIKEGKLWVTFTSSVVKNEMMMVKEGLLTALNEKVGEQVVKEIIIM